jgi:hypothetical protein
VVLDRRNKKDDGKRQELIAIDTVEECCNQLE